MSQSERFIHQMGFLLIGDHPDVCRPLEEALRSHSDVISYAESPFPCDPLTGLRRLWTGLQVKYTPFIVIGEGSGCMPALLLSELHPPDMLILMDPCARRMSSFRKLSTLACRNLFLLTAPMITIHFDYRRSSLPRSVVKAASSALHFTDFSVSELALSIFDEIDRFTSMTHKK